MATNDPKPIPELSARLIDKFWSYVDRRGPDDCWLWKAGLYADGYGHFHAWPLDLRSNRVAFFIGHRIQPNQVCHTCDIRYPVSDRTYRRCCNPNHLASGTRSENQKHMSESGRVQRGERHYKARFTDADVKKIHDLRATGMLQRLIAEEMHCHLGVVAQILNGRRRKYYNA